MARVGSALLWRRWESFSAAVSCVRLTDCLLTDCLLLALADLSEWKLKLLVARRAGTAADTCGDAMANKHDGQGPWRAQIALTSAKNEIRSRAARVRAPRNELQSGALERTESR
ncbi:hypothetical protein IMZ48_02490 [Candidatus Bathyarchaeota archaeon]|nr:hypothetical protein [Candidatus Bathyarchaeota archaeon]